jgi:hypothetical protein
MHVSRDAGGGIGFSLIRAKSWSPPPARFTAVPLGKGVEVRIPRDPISTAESAFLKTRPGFRIY